MSHSLSIVTSKLQFSRELESSPLSGARYLLGPPTPQSGGESPRNSVTLNVESPVPIITDHYVFYCNMALTDEERAYLTRVFERVLIYDPIIHVKCKTVNDLPGSNAIIFNLQTPGVHEYVQRVYPEIHESKFYHTIGLNKPGWTVDMTQTLETLKPDITITKIDVTKPPDTESFIDSIFKSLLPVVETGFTVAIKKTLSYTKLWAIFGNLVLWGLYTSTGKCKGTITMVDPPPSN